MRIDFELTRLFFDRANVDRALRMLIHDADAYRRYAMYLRKVAIHSIRQTHARPGSKAWRKASDPNSPPRSRDPQRRLKRILAGFDYKEAGMVIGPVFFKGTSGTTVPSIHEKAKTAIIVRNRYKVRMGKARSKAQAEAYKRKLKDGTIPYPQPIGTYTRVVKYPPRPFMWPAAEKTAHKFPDMWRKSVRLR